MTRWAGRSLFLSFLLLGGCEDDANLGNVGADADRFSVRDAFTGSRSDGGAPFGEWDAAPRDTAVPDATPIPADLGPPVESCPEGQVPVGSRCEYLCFRDNECALDEYCNAESVCLPHPACAEIMPCPDTCTGWCVQAGGEQCQLGATRCAENAVVEECRATDDEGVNGWVATRACALGETCQNGQCVESGGPGVPGGCQNECLPNQQRCVGQQIQQCGQGADGCTVWMPPMNCPNGEACADGWCGGEPPCASNCAVEGSETCIGDLVAVCEEVEPGCMQYTQPRECGADRVCRGFGCSCVDECQLALNECVDDTTIRVCRRVPDGCYQYADPQPCPDNQRCQNGRCFRPAGCQNNCVDAGEGTVECFGAFSTRVCERDRNDCLNWSNPTPCGGTSRCVDDRCEAPGENCMNTCEDANQRTCIDNEVHLCQQDAMGCLALQRIQICGADQVCENGACVIGPPEPCEDECMGPVCLDENTPQNCVVNASGCRVLQRGAQCGINLVCVDGECECEHACELGETRCEGDWAQRCGVGVGNCREWRNDSLCIGGRVCDDGACVDE